MDQADMAILVAIFLLSFLRRKTVEIWCYSNRFRFPQDIYCMY